MCRNLLGTWTRKITRLLDISHLQALGKNGPEEKLKSKPKVEDKASWTFLKVLLPFYFQSQQFANYYKIAF